MSEPMLPPPPPPPTDGGGAGPGAPALPWEDRARHGAVPALVETVKLFVTSPAAAFARARRRGDLTSPLVFAVLLGWLGVVVQSLWQLAFGSSFTELLGPLLKDQALPGLAAQGVGLAVQIVLAPIAILVVLFIGAGIVHLMLMLVGGTKSSEAGFEGTLRALSYSTVSQLAALVPFAGGLIAMVWAIVLETIGLADLHRTSTGKALAAVLLPLVLCCACAVFAFGSIVALIAGAAATGAGN
jgi:hypothetical protein